MCIAWLDKCLTSKWFLPMNLLWTTYAKDVLYLTVLYLQCCTDSFAKKKSEELISNPKCLWKYSFLAINFRLGQRFPEGREMSQNYIDRFVIMHKGEQAFPEKENGSWLTDKNLMNSLPLPATNLTANIKLVELKIHWLYGDITPKKSLLGNVWLFGILTLDGYLKPNPVYTYILYIWLVCE